MEGIANSRAAGCAATSNLYVSLRTNFAQLNQMQIDGNLSKTVGKLHVFGDLALRSLASPFAADAKPINRTT